MADHWLVDGLDTAELLCLARITWIDLDDMMPRAMMARMAMPKMNPHLRGDLPGWLSSGFAF